MAKSKNNAPGSKPEKTGFFQTLEWILALALVITVVVLLFTPSSKAKPVGNAALGLFAALMVISSVSDLKHGRTNLLLVIGGAICLIFGYQTIKSYSRLENLRDDKAAKIEDKLVEIANDELYLDLESDIDKQEKKFHQNLYITIAGAVIYGLGYAARGGKEKERTVIESVTVLNPQSSAPVPDDQQAGYKFCSNCGARIMVTAKFCQHCGSKCSQ